MRKNELRLRAF